MGENRKTKRKGCIDRLQELWNGQNLEPVKEPQEIEDMPLQAAEQEHKQALLPVQVLLPERRLSVLLQQLHCIHCH